MTELRYLPANDDVTEFEATVVETADNYVILDGTHFYPGGGGQPIDRGTLSWPEGEATVVDVRKNQHPNVTDADVRTVEKAMNQFDPTQ